MKPDTRPVNTLVTEELETQLQELWDRVQVAKAIFLQDYKWFGPREYDLVFEMLMSPPELELAKFWGTRVIEIHTELVIRGEEPRWPTDRPPPPPIGWTPPQVV